MLIGLDILPALGVEPRICPEALREAEERLRQLGLEVDLSALGDLEGATRIAVELTVKGLTDNVNYLSLLYGVLLLSVRSRCPGEFQNAAALLAVIGFDSLRRALTYIINIAGIEPGLLKTLIELKMPPQPKQ
ncbi:hypothetical protein Pogu_1924 [Pyrobaculum oguniense TE7]|uniref:Uncharacterized protein n=1 Tax=Pyrobaculum oguniense (strain DSM 13380 / JCM 10595 / TE7) TaxID=698757 RepID=H6QCI3_PYROT|nr:hypothetical protein Pogu_1924 [Pyrobaculum oguniense TE7]